MKKLPFVFLAFLTLPAFSQTDKGATIVGGSLSLQTTKNNSNFSFNPNIGFFPANNFALGAGLNLNFSKQGDVKNNVVGFGPYARYYFWKNSTKPFFTVEGSYLNNKYEALNDNGEKVELSSSGFGLLIGLGFAAFINDVVAVEGLTGYNYSDFKNNSGSGGFTMRLGFQLYFSRKSYSDLKTNVIGKTN
jgi:hypothetical protein